jgi:hypothetical protein
MVVFMDKNSYKKSIIFWVVILGIISSILTDTFISYARKKYYSENEITPTIAMIAGTGSKDTDLQENDFSTSLKRLVELDREIKSQKEPKDNYTYLEKINFENSILTLWENELKSIEEVILNRIDDADISKLVNSQDEWRKSRDKKAAEIAGTEIDSDSKDLKYIKFIKEATRNRAYELLKNYKDVLEK